MRTFYFLKDSVSDKFYTGQNEHLSNLDGAAVYFKEANARARIKGIIQSWTHYLKYPVEEKYRNGYSDYGEPFPNDIVKERKDLPDCGVIIVKGIIGKVEEVK